MLLAVAGCALAPGAAFGGSRHRAVTHADRVGAHAYLLDMYEYAQAAASAAPAILSAYEGAANKIAAECPGVIAGTPRENKIEVGFGVHPMTARQRGEAKRRTAQTGDLRSEVTSSLSAAEQGVLAPLREALLAKLKTLPSLDPALAGFARSQVQLVEEGLHAPPPEACADMKAWVASDYRTLSSASRALAMKDEAAFLSFLEHSSHSVLGVQPPAAEGRADRDLAAKTAQLELNTAKRIAGAMTSVRRRIEVQLGFEIYLPSSKVGTPEKKSPIKIGAGRTAAGSKYTVWLERKKGGSAYECKLSVQVRGASGAAPGLVEILQSESDICLKPREDRSNEPSVKCNNGLLTIRTEVAPATRTVALRMSDGAEFVSRPVLVSRRLGGPDAFYYQAVRGPSPIPISLIERDAHGSVLRTVKLLRIVGCSKHPVKYAPGGKQTLVSGQAPQGPRFSIVGERFRLYGRARLQLKLTTGEGLITTTSYDEEGTESPLESFPVPVKRTAPLNSEITAGCSPHEYSIFYGLLSQPRDVVLAKISGKLAVLPRVQIPPSLHIRGVLVYLASTAQPEKIVVRSPSGKLLMSEDRASQTTEGRETCEGESEGSGPTPSFLGGTGETSRIVISSG